MREDALSLDLGASTKALCPPDSLDDRFEQDLQGVTVFKRDGDTLVLYSETSGQSLQLPLRGE